MQKITKKKIVIAAAIAIVLLICLIIIRSCTKGSGEKFEYQDVTVGNVEKTISVTGALDVSDRKNVISKCNGILSKLHVDFNQEVRKGQVLAEIDTVEVDLTLKKMAAQLESVKLELAIANDDLESKKSMFKDNLISDKGLERAQFNCRTVQLKYKQIQVDYENARTQKNNSRIISPITGIVLNIMVTEGSPVAMNTPLFIIVPGLKKMNLTISVDESDIGLVRKDQRVKFTVSAFPEKTFYGRIEKVHINPVNKGGLITYESIVECDNDELLLKPGMTATATIEINKRENVIRVPNQALLVTPLEGQSEIEKNTLWRKSGTSTGKLPVEKVKVEIGLRGDTYTEIKKNLKKGDKILIKYIRAPKGSSK